VKRSIALSILLAGISATVLSRAEMPDAYKDSGVNHYAGKSGRGLVETIRRESRPARLVTTGDVTFTFSDPFEGAEVSVVKGVMPQGYDVGHIVPPKWWIDIAGCDTLARDLHNFLPLTSAPRVALASRRPGEPTEITSSFAHWSEGRAEIYGTMTDLYAPPVSMRGRIARTYFYAAALYHTDILTTEGYMMMQPEYPYLTPYAKGLLCEWARQAPDADELAWAEYAAKMQGGGNPFVTEPELAEYIWGDKAGETYTVEGEPVPLHSTYTMGDDRIYLISPHVPADAVWSIDGMPAMSDSYSSEELGVGEHHLTYASKSTGSSGRLMIKIVSK